MKFFFDIWKSFNWMFTKWKFYWNWWMKIKTYIQLKLKNESLQNDYSKSLKTLQNSIGRIANVCSS